MKRLAVFLFYDKSGIFSKYDEKVLDDIKENADKVYVLTDLRAKENIKGLDNENIISYDVKSNVTILYIKALELSKTLAKDFNEILFFSNEIVGPFYKLDKYLNKMSEVNADIVSLTSTKDIKGLIHMPFEFMLVKKSFILNNSFDEIVNRLKKDNLKETKEFKIQFSKYFFEKGLIYKEIIEKNENFCDNPEINAPLYMLEKCKYPFIYYKALINNYDEILRLSCGNQLNAIFDYIKNKKIYNSVLKKILKEENLADIKNNFQLNYVLSKDFSYNKYNKNKKVALFLHLYYTDIIEDCFKYVKNMPEGCDIYITTPSDKNCSFIKEYVKDRYDKMYNIKVLVVENRGRDVSALLVGLRDYFDLYDYICFVHDKKSGQSKPFMIGEAFAYNCYENVLASPQFVENIIGCFEENKMLGMLVPPPPCHGPYYQTIGKEWQSNYKNTLELKKELRLECKMSSDKPPIAPLGTMFWFRKGALDVLKNRKFDYADFPKEPTGENDGNIMHAIERIYPFVVQQAGFFVGWIMNNRFAEIETTNLYFYLSQINCAMVDSYGKATDRQFYYAAIKKNSKLINILKLDVPFAKRIKIIIRKIMGEDNYINLWKIKTKFIKKIKSLKINYRKG